MYYPYFRGKQFELVAIKECSELIAGIGIVPIIEPVRARLTQLENCLDLLHTKDSACILIVNPAHGELSKNGQAIEELVLMRYSQFERLQLAFLLEPTTTIPEIQTFLTKSPSKEKVLLHNGFSDGKGLADTIASEPIARHIFIDDKSSRSYQKRFSSTERVLVRDGFIARRNRDYPEDEFFSDLHWTYKDMNYDGFGDFLIVGDEYSEAGGPAYAVAIHMTYVDYEQDRDIRIMHFKSDSTESPVDPAGKFFEALEKLKQEMDRGGRIPSTPACEEFLHLYNEERFPGLGVVKKLSMKHHLQLLARFLSSEPNE